MPHSSKTAGAPQAGRREWVGLAVIALPCLLYSMDLTVLNLAVPQLSADLGPSGAQLLWIMDIYGFLIAGFLITMGTLGDRIGRRRLLMIGAAAFGAASVLAAFARSTETLIAARAVLGVAGATLAPATLSLIRNMFHDPRERTTAIAVWATSFSVGGAVGPLFGGVLLQYFWWGSVFLLAVPVMVLLLIVGPILLPEYRDAASRRLDLTSVALSLGAVLSTVYGLKRLAEGGFKEVLLLPVAAGLVLATLFVRRQRTLEDPMIDLRLFRHPAFSAALATNFFSIFAAFSSFLFLAQYLQLVLGLSPLAAGLWSLPSSIGFIAGSLITPALSRAFPRRSVIVAGLVIAAVGLAVLGHVDGSGGLAPLVAGSVILSLGLSPPVTLTTDLIVGTVPPEKAGMASGISETGAELGGALGIAILGSIGTAIYRSRLGVAAAGMPIDTSDPGLRTLGGAISAAGSLPEPASAALLLAARSAFASSMRSATVIGAVLLILTAIAAAVLLRSRRETSPGAPLDR